MTDVLEPTPAAPTQGDLPVMTEQEANSYLDSAVDTIIQLQDEHGQSLELTAKEKLRRVFGDVAPLVAHIAMFTAVHAFEAGQLSVAASTDRTDILVNALRKVHVPEMYGDCVSDGDVYPCTTARALNLVQGHDPHRPSIDDELAALLSDEVPELDAPEDPAKA
ncbi:hypothetical protein [Microbacterium sp. 77mftsu3.1]|uniref:hypothetical protein n=1 Tax=Microbacterium sp. 77mftsu3.1 TaxID=1761802 RepID=UPI00036055C3|nr:hypothetical protein [Microbacterium sp. 77mftsu3.1]SDH33510.1 hypothetical protein SAMN04488590_3058 [Microbacterium sp. 77mftsu3.1]